jgi:hypothetical protein
MSLAMDSTQELRFSIRAGQGYERPARLLLYNRSGRPPRACFDVIFARLFPCAAWSESVGGRDGDRKCWTTTALRPPKVGSMEPALKVLTLVRGDAGLLE